MATTAPPKDHQPKKMSAADILALDDVRKDVVFIPEWDTEITVIGLTKRQQLDIRQRSLVEDEPDAEKSQQLMWMEGVLDPKFTEDQLPALFEKNAGAIDRVLTRVLELSGMKPEDVTKQKEAKFPAK